MILDKARDLGKLIKEDVITERFFEASENYKNDTALKNLIYRYNIEQTALREERGRENRNEELISSAAERASALYGQIIENPTYKAYIAAQDALNELIENVNREITIAVFGNSAAETCAHDCASCSGCK